MEIQNPGGLILKIEGDSGVPHELEDGKEHWLSPGEMVYTAELMQSERTIAAYVHMNNDSIISVKEAKPEIIGLGLGWGWHQRIKSVVRVEGETTVVSLDTSIREDPEFKLEALKDNEIVITKEGIGVGDTLFVPFAYFTTGLDTSIAFKQVKRDN